MINLKLLLKQYERVSRESRKGFYCFFFGNFIFLQKNKTCIVRLLIYFIWKQGFRLNFVIGVNEIFRTTRLFKRLFANSGLFEADFERIAGSRFYL